MGESGDQLRRPFAGETAGFYSRYRREYPAELVERFAVCGSSRVARLLDLGCGTGALALQLAPFFLRVVGVDPEPDMLREAENAARGRGVENVEWVRGSSDELQELARGFERFNLVTIGTAFHFMAPLATLGELQRIAPGGVVAVAYAGTPMWLHPDPWAKAVRVVLENRLGPLSDVDFTAEALRDAEGAMRQLGYSQVERWEQTRAETIDLDFVAGHILSAVSTDQIRAEDRQGFAQELSTAVKAVAGSETVVETVCVRAVLAHTDTGL
jgi:SAM-dependent methyltransferase